jgi:hypothetical protein
MCLASPSRNHRQGGSLKITIATALLCTPFLADAQTLLVEYQGTVSSVDRAPLAEAVPYSVGDSISGTLIIDAALAPLDKLPGDPRIGRYSGGTPGVDFILGPTRPAGPGTGDLLLVYDNWASPSGSAAPQDGILIRDQSIGTEGEFNVVLGMLRPNLLGQLFFDDGPVQTFAVEREPGTSLWGYIERGFGELWRAVNFTLDRFSIRPGVCRR